MSGIAEHERNGAGPGKSPACRRWLAALALPALLWLGACASTDGTAPGDAEAALDRDMFVTGFEDIQAVYITPPDIPGMAVAGLQQLSALDPDISAKRVGDKIELLVKDQPVDTIDVNDGMDAKEWGETTAEMLDDARAESAKLRAVSDEKIYASMFSGVIGKLDAFSRYASAEVAKENRATRDGFGGIGVRISVEDNTVRVISVMHYTPAERLGVKRDDIITAIDGGSTEGLTQQDVVNKLRGPVDSRVTLTLKRENVATPIDVTLSRAHVVPETVSYRREGQIAYFRIYSFNSETTESLKREITDAQTEIGPRLTGYIIDLRQNPGGLLNQAVSVSNLFLDEGRIVSTHGRHPDSHQYFEASDGDITKGKPIVALVDGNSASAAEIVAAALQDNGRAVVVGSNSYGKGTVQTVLPMPNQGEITLTWARFHAPSGYTLHHLGVLPSVCTVGEEDADQLVHDLMDGRMAQVPTAKRNATKPDDTKALDALRNTCPARQTEEAIDMEVAMKILDKPDLFAEAIHLAQPPQVSASDQPSDSQIPLQP